MVAILPVAAFMHLAATCAPGQPAGILAAIAKVESGFNPLALHDNTDARTYQPATREDAVAQASVLIRRGHSVDLGLMQINSANLTSLHLSVAEAFDPCRSLAAGAGVLGPAYRAALSTYNTGAPDRGLAYAQRVDKAATSLQSAPPEAKTAGQDKAPTDPWDRFVTQGKAYLVFDQ